MNNIDYNYGILTYNSLNIGDEIQSIAAARFFPEIQEFIPRERVNSYKSPNGRKTKLIMNAWWMWEAKNFPPSNDIEPLMISMHIRQEVRKEFSKNKKIKKYLQEHSPIGCRDINTYKWLTDIGIDAYFSGCLTLTLLRNDNIERENYILCVDVEKDIVEEIKKRTDRPVYDITRNLSPFYTSKERLELAKLFLSLYHNAHCVVSPCLHAILPSAAFETPVLRIIEQDEKMHVNSRFEGMEDWFTTYTTEEFLNNKDIYDFENPPQNSTKYTETRDFLIKKCTDFTGYCSNISPVQKDTNPFIELLKLNTFTFEKVQKMLFFESGTVIKDALKLKKKGVNRYTYVDGMPIISAQTMFKLKTSRFKYLILSLLFFKKNKKINQKYSSKKEYIEYIEKQMQAYRK